MLHIFCPNHKFSGRCFSLQYAVFPPFKVSFVTAWLSFIKKKNVSLLVSCLVLLPVFALLCLIVSLCSPVVFLPPLPSCVLSCDYPAVYLICLPFSSMFGRRLSRPCYLPGPVFEFVPVSRAPRFADVKLFFLCHQLCFIKACFLLLDLLSVLLHLGPIFPNPDIILWQSQNSPTPRTLFNYLIKCYE